ncbi:hypothetical protein RRG08_061947 [Elysia crispata]|uniref:Uncharacterized protein n=1 Tax=Elysia crispata TaxID=231223 RepID=A0AAE0ZIM6_9GAST|nr:hypothetical protein RRG08_061947 [Elysia crispata]
MRSNLYPHIAQSATESVFLFFNLPTLTTRPSGSYTVGIKLAIKPGHPYSCHQTNNTLLAGPFASNTVGIKLRNLYRLDHPAINTVGIKLPTLYQLDHLPVTQLSPTTNTLPTGPSASNTVVTNYEHSTD